MKDFYPTLVAVMATSVSCSPVSEQPNLGLPEKEDKEQQDYSCAFDLLSNDLLQTLEHPGATAPGVARCQNEWRYTYHVECPSFLGCATLQDEVRRAMDSWQSVPGLVLVEASSREHADLRISFEEGMHEGTHRAECKTDSGFSSRLYTTAHALLDGCQAGEIHMNMELPWSMADGRSMYDNKGRLKFDVRTVVLHEIGHLLGLSHNQDETSVMFANYMGKRRTVKTEYTLITRTSAALRNTTKNQAHHIVLDKVYTREFCQPGEHWFKAQSAGTWFLLQLTSDENIPSTVELELYKEGEEELELITRSVGTGNWEQLELSHDVADGDFGKLFVRVVAPEAMKYRLELETLE